MLNTTISLVGGSTVNRERIEAELTGSWLAALPIDPRAVCACVHVCVCVCVCERPSPRCNWHREYLYSPVGACVYICTLFPGLYSL